ncbi:hypothetical protein [Thioalkalivibrio thiocyanodenitrificans]|uniref:hypothetical protein n=1 Tax=Thioalkalivibrio thiocyanodenitrificans TaxID=243063 RepID=UPI00038004E4|nr:hypothetical protein [Thioalkalivibrio thiocyanodenitrificans]
MKHYDVTPHTCNDPWQDIVRREKLITQSVREKVRRENLPLVSWLFEEAARQGLDTPGLASLLKVTLGYLEQLKRGVRSTRAISYEFSTSCARFLNVPRVAVLLAADQLSMEDYYASTDSLARDVDRALDVVRRDPEWSVWLPRNIHAADYEVKQLVVIEPPRELRRLVGLSQAAITA